jgi:hypothetical protein
MYTQLIWDLLAERVLGCMDRAERELYDAPYEVPSPTIQTRIAGRAKST